MAKKDFLAIFFLLIVFATFILVKGNTLTYSFNKNLINDYLRSQDIEDINDKIKDRIFVSDSDIYISAGYLYSAGNDPADYNFQHPPLIKYLFGYSIQLFNNPYIVQFLFGALFVAATYFLGLKVFKNRTVSLVGSLLLFLDPLFSGVFNEALLDLGQATLSLFYVISTLFYPSSFILQGISLGLFAASKFWSTALFFVAIIYGYKLINKKGKINVKVFILSLVIALLIFSATYLKTLTGKGILEFVLNQGKVLRFMLRHNAATTIGGPLILFLTGYFSDWWRGNLSRITDWSILWPISFINSLYQAIRIRKINMEFLIFLLPILYLIYISGQVPFSRYFIIVLPYFYLGLSNSFVKIIKKKV